MHVQLVSAWYMHSTKTVSMQACIMHMCNGVSRHLRTMYTSMHTESEAVSIQSWYWGLMAIV